MIMKNIFSQWISDVVMISLLSSIASALCENMNAAKRSIPIITTAALMIVTVVPLKGNDINDLIHIEDMFENEYLSDTYDRTADELTKRVTTERLSEYAERRLRENGVDGSVYVAVSMTDEGYYAPSYAEVKGGEASGEEKKKLSVLLKSELSCDTIYWDGERQ